MRLDASNNPVFFPSDLAQFAASPFVSWMNRLALSRPDLAPASDATAERTRSHDQLAGVASEIQRVELEQRLQAHAKVCVDAGPATDPVAATQAALAAGAEVIQNAVLQHQHWHGAADFLVRVGPAEVGVDADYGVYEVWLMVPSQSLQPEATLMACCLVDLLEAVHPGRAQQFRIFTADGLEHELRVADFYFYYQAQRDQFMAQQVAFDPHQPLDPSHYHEWGPWSAYARQRLADCDHLSQVAHITQAQIGRLEAAGIKTVAALANSANMTVPGISPALMQRLCAQAQIQREGRAGVPAFQVLSQPAAQRRGLALLPPSHGMDVFVATEAGSSRVSTSAHSWGAAYFDASGQCGYREFRAQAEEGEAAAFVDFIGWVYERWRTHPGVHIYHFGTDTINACRQLMGRYGQCEYEVDTLLRHELFVDLRRVVVEGVLIGTARYELEQFEALYGPGRGETEAAESAHSSERALQHSDSIRHDCVSMQRLACWLRKQQTLEAIDWVAPAVNETGDAADELSEEVVATRALRDQLLQQSQALSGQHPQQAALITNLAWSLEFHRRENKPIYWRLFDRLAQSEWELYEDLDCLVGCRRMAVAARPVGGRSRQSIFQYQFDPQQPHRSGKFARYYIATSIATNAAELGSLATITLRLDECDFERGLLSVQCGSEPLPELTLIPDEMVPVRPIPAAVAAVVGEVAGKASQTDRQLHQQSNQNSAAILDFMGRQCPRIQGYSPATPIISEGAAEQRLQQIVAAALALDHSCLTLQGPPGAGKTFTGKHIIAAMMQRGWRIGISSNSHKAIHNLLLSAMNYCAEQRISLQAACTREPDLPAAERDAHSLVVLKNNQLADWLEEQGHSGCLVGTTAWGFARADLESALDVLIIDEAGQVATANLIGMSRSARNLILMGDQMQLGQPAQGTHPAQSGLSTLDYLLHEQATIKPEQGIFLDTTFRMHPAVNDFISAAFYEERLQAHSDNARQQLKLPAPLPAAGLVYMPVAHTGNTQASEEEAQAIQQLVSQILGCKFVARNGVERVIGWDDVLIVAPYNHQVNRLQALLGDTARVGTVDKFQGQEAPVVFYSLCSSDASQSARGLEFLFEPNRFNVAISRAQALAVVVAAPALLTTTADTIAQQRLINTYCRYVQAATQIDQARLAELVRGAC